MTRFIAEYKQCRTAGLRWGVEPICDALQVYYAARQRPACRRRLRDEDLKPIIQEIFDDNFGVYGARKMWRQLKRDGHPVLKCTVERLMRQMGLVGRTRGRKRRTTIPADVSMRPADLVDRCFEASRPNELWIADITYVPTWSGFAYAAFIADVFSRRIIGWRVSNTLRADLALDALEMAIWTRNLEDLAGVKHHSDRGIQYLSIRYTDRLAEEGAVMSVGSRGDSYDNAMAESINGLYKSELIYNERFGPWRTVEDVELATLSWVHWWNQRRLHSSIGNIPPIEYEQNWREANTRSTLCCDLSASNNNGGMRPFTNTNPGESIRLVTQ